MKKRTIIVICSIALFLLLVVGGGLLYINNAYLRNLAPVSNSTKTQYFSVEPGATASQIARNLESAGLIKSASAFEFYVREQNVRDKLQAGTYILSPDMGTKKIVTKLTGGEIARGLLTILPGKRLDQIKAAFLESGYDQAAVDAAFVADQYRDHPALQSLPAGASLEGYLYPDSYERLVTTVPSTIIRASLDELQRYLTPDLVAAFSAQGLNVYQALTVTSIIDQEVSKIEDKPVVAQVFMRRLREGIPLGADPTSRYASLLAGLNETDYSLNSPYNTRVVVGLPPSPIGNVTIKGLQALAKPANTNYLFFVAGDDGTTHFSFTQAEHEALTKKYCTKLCVQ